MAKLNKKDETLLLRAIKRLDMAIRADQHNRVAAVEDLYFINGEQWDSAEKNRREGADRPVLTINLLPKFVDQVKGDILHNQPCIKIRPSDATGDTNIAKIRQGIIKDIEYSSHAENIYAQASSQMVACGYGSWRVLTKYTAENPFQQEIFLESIKNPFLVYLDPSSKGKNSHDARWGFILEKVPRDEFKDRYPNAKIPTGDINKDLTGVSMESWYSDDTITVAEYFTVEYENQDMAQLRDGRVMSLSDANNVVAEWENTIGKAMDDVISGGPFNQNIQPKPEIVNIKSVQKPTIYQRLITSSEILSGPDLVPGDFIPIVLLKGKELNIEGKNYIKGLIRDAKDPQKMVNYWNSSAAETIALAPKSPWLGTPKQFENFEKDYASANVENTPFLMYNNDPDAPGPPQRVAPAQAPTAIFEQIRRGEENIKSVLGMFNADIGQGGSEQTGVAIAARQRPGDIVNYEFMNNLAHAIQYTGMIIDSMIPTVYDTERSVQVRNDDGSDTFVPINTTVDNAIKLVSNNPEQFSGVGLDALKKLPTDAKYNDVTSGKYKVIVTVGPSYATQRQESAQHLLELTRAMPEQMAMASDLIVKNLDFKDSDELSRRLRAPLVAQGIVEPRPDDVKPPQPQGPSPEQKLQESLVQVEASKVQVNEIKAENERVKIELEKLRMERDIAMSQVQMAKQMAESKHKQEQAQRDYQIDEAKLRREMLKIMKEMQPTP